MLSHSYQNIHTIAIMSSSDDEVATIVGNIAKAAKDFVSKDSPGSRNSLIRLAQQLIVNLELPSESIQRMGWAKVG
jgi:hypothetical protein